jgi:hypothetical protein
VGLAAFARREARLLGKVAPDPRVEQQVCPQRTGRRTPEHAYLARRKATPAKPSIPVHYRVRRDKTDTSGVFSLRYGSQQDAGARRSNLSRGF